MNWSIFPLSRACFNVVIVRFYSDRERKATPLRKVKNNNGLTVLGAAFAAFFVITVIASISQPLAMVLGGVSLFLMLARFSILTVKEIRASRDQRS